MSNVLNDYAALSNTSPRNTVTDVLNAVINASPIAFDSATRTQLIQSIINDLNTCHYGGSGSGKGRLTTGDSAQAILAVKSLGRHPAGSQCIASQSNISILLRLASLKDLEASNEALRCIANSMLLVESARETFVQTDVGGRAAATELLEKSGSPDRIFLASRILFLATVSSSVAGPFIRSLVEDKISHSKTMLDVIGAKLDLLSLGILGGTKMAREAMTDLLKFVFNLLLHYPKIADSDSSKGKNSASSSSQSEPKQLGEAWHHRLDDLLPPLLRVFNSMPPLFPSPLGAPLTHVIHSLIAIPVTDNLRSHWLPPSNSSSSRSTRASTPSSPRTSSDTSPIEGPSSSKGSGPMDKALSVLAAGRRSLSRSPSPMPSARPRDTLLRAYDLLEVSLSYYFPGKIDADHISVRDRAKSEGDNTCDDLLSPLVLLITRLCAADENSRKRMREWVVPADLDRTAGPLEERADILGRCLRLMSSVYHERLKSTVGEMLFTMYDSDASILSANVGYGNVAGFLFNKGIMSAPPPPSDGTSASVPGDNINPITGVVNQPRPNVQEEMTEEEKEREAEKLFVLFDRLEKTGALPPEQNPIRKAIKEGKVGGPGI